MIGSKNDPSIAAESESRQIYFLKKKHAKEHFKKSSNADDKWVHKDIPLRKIRGLNQPLGQARVRIHKNASKELLHGLV